MTDKSRITVWLRPDHQTEGKYGCVTNDEWLKCERERFNHDTRKSDVYFHPTEDLKALFYTGGFYEGGEWVSLV